YFDTSINGGPSALRLVFAALVILCAFPSGGRRPDTAPARVDASRLVRIWGVGKPSPSAFPRGRKPGERMIMSVEIKRDSDLAMLAAQGFTILELGPQYAPAESAPGVWDFI